MAFEVVNTALRLASKSTRFPACTTKLQGNHNEHRSRIPRSALRPAEKSHSKQSCVCCASQCVRTPYLSVEVVTITFWPATMSRLPDTTVQSSSPAFATILNVEDDSRLSVDTRNLDTPTMMFPYECQGRRGPSLW
jgi:hypothetical protein